MDYKKEFIELLETTNRQGIDDLVEELEDLGFFKAPASTKFHLNEDGGLVQHSLNVCKAALSFKLSSLDNLSGVSALLYGHIYNFLIIERHIQLFSQKLTDNSSAAAVFSAYGY